MTRPFTVLHFVKCFVLCVFITKPISANDWTNWRGPTLDGHSAESGLPTSWSPMGQNLTWKVPIGGRSTPIVMGENLYLQTSVGKGKTLQERVICFNVDTGEIKWEHRVNIFMSDVPTHRVGWASPVGDAQTKNVYAFTVGGTLVALTRDGRLLWERSLTEEFGLITTHGGRTSSPIIDSELVIVSGLNSGWGEQARGGQRFFAFDKHSGETIWISSPGGRPYDTTYSPPLLAAVSGRKLLIAGGGDGAVHAILPQTGKSVWRFEFSKRGINTGTVLRGNTAFVSHSEENLKSSQMGLVAAIDATSKGDIHLDSAKWKVEGFLGGFSSPVLVHDRLYQVDNSANLIVFNTETGNEVSKLNLGTIQRASPVFADGRLYVGTANGTFYIIEPNEPELIILDQDKLGSEKEIEEIIASVAIADGRIYLVSSSNLYAIGAKNRQPSSNKFLLNTPDERTAGEPESIQVAPTELILAPDDVISFTARLFDENGIFIREEDVNWSLIDLPGTVNTQGTFRAGQDASAGRVVATLGDLSGSARVRIIPPLPWNETFDSMTQIPKHWINATGKFELRTIEDGQVLVKKADNPFLRRARVYMGPPNWSDMTITADVMAIEKKRQMGNVGVLAQRYAFVIMGNHQRAELRSWQPETARTARTSFSWKGDVWYRLKLHVENRADGTVRARGKAWPRYEAEPSSWTVERIDTIPNKVGSPGIVADATPNEVFIDNIEVINNQ